MRNKIANRLFWVLACHCVSVLIVACESTSQHRGVSNAIQFAYPRLGFAGKNYKLLTFDDVHQIMAVARTRRDILKPVHLIIMDKQNEAEVRSGAPEAAGARMTIFKVRKANGRWMIIKGSVETTEVIITS